MLHVSVESDARVCDPRDTYNCSTPALNDFVVSWASTFRERCDCLPACSTTVFQVQVSANKMSNFALDTIARNLISQYICSNDTGVEVCDYEPDINSSVVDMQENFVDLLIYYENLNVEVVKEEEGYSVLALLCDIGGAMGLILGSTVLTVAEVFEFLTHIIYDAIFFKVSQMSYWKRPPTRR